MWQIWGWTRKDRRRVRKSEGSEQKRPRLTFVLNVSQHQDILWLSDTKPGDITETWEHLYLQYVCGVKLGVRLWDFFLLFGVKTVWFCCSDFLCVKIRCFKETCRRFLGFLWRQNWMFLRPVDFFFAYCAVENQGLCEETWRHFQESSLVFLRRPTDISSCFSGVKSRCVLRRSEDISCFLGCFLGHLQRSPAVSMA